jgi:TPR repeat protein
MRRRRLKGIDVLGARLIAGIALCLGLVACSDYDVARRAYEAGEYSLAIQRFEALAANGHAQAQYDLAQIYFQGIGVPRDGRKGWYWLLSAAGTGNVAAMVQLGALFESGVGADRDYATAAQWYLRAARKGDAVGRFNLASMYLKGLGVPKDEIAALAWFRLSFKAGGAAARDHADAVERLLTKDELLRVDELVKRLQEVEAD